MLLIHRDTEFIPLPEDIYERKANWRQVKQKWHITQSHSAIFNRTVNIKNFVPFLQVFLLRGSNAVMYSFLASYAFHKIEV